MSVSESMGKIVSFFKFLKPRTFLYGRAPQTIKPRSVTVTPSDYGFYDGNDGGLYVKKTISCKKKVTFSDGQKFADGEQAYFRVDPVEWEIGGVVYVKEEIKNRRGDVVKTKYKKSDSVYCTTKYVLAQTGCAYEKLLTEDADEKFEHSRVHAIETYGDCLGGYSSNGNFASAAKRNAVKKASDYAIACGVTVKGQKAYHTLMQNNQCAAPNGKRVKAPAKLVAGELLRFTAKKDDLLR